MKYDFTTVMDRLGKDAMAVDLPASGEDGGFFAGAKVKEGFSIIPMWVADMNFPTVPAVPKALMERAAHPAYGYFRPPKAYYDAVIRWHEERYGTLGLTPECIGYENGVLGGVVSALKIFCQPGDSIVVQSPTYIGFTHCAEDNGWKLVLNPLVQDRDGVWRIDYGDLERKLSGGDIHTAIFCSPHNPSGRVWEEWEIRKLMEEVRLHEPLSALDGHEDGLFFYRRIIGECPDYLVRGGSLYLEIGWDQGGAVKALMEEAGFHEVRVTKDYAGLDRVVSGVWF